MLWPGPTPVVVAGLPVEPHAPNAGLLDRKHAHRFGDLRSTQVRGHETCAQRLNAACNVGPSAFAQIVRDFAGSFDPSAKFTVGA